MLNIRMYPARNGDAFLLCADRATLLIDGGYSSTFNNYIIDDLQQLASEGQALDLVINTHIDADHIGGILRFLSINGAAARPEIIQIKRIWHNSLRSLTAPQTEPVEHNNEIILNALTQRGYLTPNEEEQGAKAISARQGNTLASLIHDGQYDWNEGDGLRRISVESMPGINLPGGRVTVLTPSNTALDKLLVFWQKSLRRFGFKGEVGADSLAEDAFECGVSHLQEAVGKPPSLISAGRPKQLGEVYRPDTSVTNASSIATLVELDGCRILMLADAPAEDIVHQLKILQAEGCSLLFDAIKISHHGSCNNTNPELLGLVDAPMYFISSDGSRHQHPDVEVLTAIVDRPATFSRTLYFNYRTPSSDYLKHYTTITGAPFNVEAGTSCWIEIGKRQ